MKVIVRALVRWSWVLLLCLLIGWFGGKEVAKLLPPTYQATAIVELSGRTASSAILPVATYGTLVNSDSVLVTALKNYHDLTPQSLGAKQLTVTSSNTAQTISIQVTLPNAKEAAGLANDLAQLLVQQQNANIKAQYAKQLQIVNAQLNNINKNISTLNQEVINLSQPPNGTTQNAAQIQQDQNQIQQDNQLKTQYINQQQNLITDQSLYSNPLSIVQTATVPTKPSSITGSIPLGPVTLLIVVILGLVAIGFLEPALGRINSVYALQKKAGLSILGALSWVSPSPQQVPLRTIIESKQSYAEECRVMMADVLFHAEDAQAHVLAITGLKVRSGASSVASELAALLAQSKRRVLLIDANLYQPVQHKRLGVSNERGLAKMLEEIRAMRVTPASESTQGPLAIASGEEVSMQETRRVAGVSASNPRPLVKMQQQPNAADRQSVNGANRRVVDIINGFPFDSFIEPTNIQNLYLLPAGKTNMNPSSLLSIPEMGQFLGWAAKPIDFVVIDCPALVHAEAHVLGSLSDQTYVVIDATRDRMKQVLKAREELMSTGVKLSGLILNKLGRWI